MKRLTINLIISFQPREFISKRAFQRLDLLLLAIESLDTNASQSIVFAIDKLNLQNYFPNKVEFWKLRCYNTMRKTSKNGSITQETLEALITLLSFMADFFYPKIRDLLSSKEPENIKNEKWDVFNTRFNELIIERLNIKRSIVKKYLLQDQSKFYRELVITLALASGEGGKARLKASLQDPIR